MPKYDEPDFLKQYWEWVRNGPPKCCHTCEEYDGEGICGEFNMEPPEEFVMTENACSSWVCRVPF